MKRELSQAYISQKQRTFEKDQIALSMIESGDLTVDIEKAECRNKKGKLLTSKPCPNGYVKVFVNRTFYFRLHRVVAVAASGLQPDMMLEISHKDHDKKNNAHTNLQWVTRSENIQDSCRAGLFPQSLRGPAALDPEERLLAKRLHAEGWTYGQLAKHFSIHRRTAKHWVESLGTGKPGKCLPYKCLSPTGKMYSGQNLKEFCRLMGLEYSTMNTSRARGGTKTRCGWTCLPLEPVDPKSA